MRNPFLGLTLFAGCSLILVAADAPIPVAAADGTADPVCFLRGRRIGVASRASNSELVVRVGLQRNGVDPDSGARLPFHPRLLRSSAPSLHRRTVRGSSRAPVQGGR